MGIAEHAEKDKIKIQISDLLKSHPEGLTIADIMKRTGLARHTVLARLHMLIGGEKVGVRKSIRGEEGVGVGAAGVEAGVAVVVGVGVAALKEPVEQQATPELQVKQEQPAQPG